MSIILKIAALLTILALAMSLFLLKHNNLKRADIFPVQSTETVQ